MERYSERKQQSTKTSHAIGFHQVPSNAYATSRYDKQVEIVAYKIGLLGDLLLTGRCLSSLLKPGLVRLNPVP
jgi:hypothetical protein